MNLNSSLPKGAAQHSMMCRSSTILASSLIELGIAPKPSDADPSRAADFPPSWPGGSHGAGFAFGLVCLVNV